MSNQLKINLDKKKNNKEKIIIEDCNDEDKKEKTTKKSKKTKERKYDSRNKLNDLTGAEWQFATKTIISKIYPANLQHKLRSQHGGQKPPELCEDLIKIFTKKGQKVLDPLAGVGGTFLINTVSSPPISTPISKVVEQLKILIFLFLNSF